MKVLVDVNLSPDWVIYLHNAGFEAVHWSTIGETSAPDFKILTFARTHGFFILTQDLDFGTMLALAKTPEPSVIQIRSGNTDPKLIGPLLLLALRQEEDALAAGALLTIDVKRTRLRLLPLPSKD